MTDLDSRIVRDLLVPGCNYRGVKSEVNVFNGDIKFSGPKGDFVMRRSDIENDTYKSTFGERLDQISPRKTPK